MPMAKLYAKDCIQACLPLPPPPPSPDLHLKGVRTRTLAVPSQRPAHLSACMLSESYTSQIWFTQSFLVTLLGSGLDRVHDIRMQNGKTFCMTYRQAA